MQHFLRSAALLFASPLALTSCHSHPDDPAPTPAPVAEVTMVRRLEYAQAPSHNSGLTYSQKTLSSTATLGPDNLQLAFLTTEGIDNLSFTISRAKLTAAITGTYQLQGLGNPAANKAVARYTYTRVNVPGSINATIYDSGTNEVRGTLTLTTYDATRHLLSGQYELRIANLDDPTDGSTGVANKQKCTLTVTGTFTNLSVQ